MTIRALENADIDYLANCREKDFHDGWNKSMIEGAIKTNNFFGLIAEEKKTVGFITYSIGLDFADIESVFVEKEFRGKGFASRLLDCVISEIEKRKIGKILLEVKETNIPAQKLYIKFGFKKISERKKYYDDGTTAFVFVKEIK